MDILLDNDPNARNHRRKKGKPQTEDKSPFNKWGLFAAIVSGNLAHSVWVEGWRFLAGSNHLPSVGSLIVIAVRVVLGICAAAFTFSSICEKLEEVAGNDPRLCYFLAFQQGFTFEAAFHAVTGVHS